MLISPIRKVKILNSAYLPVNLVDTSTLSRYEFDFVKKLEYSSSILNPFKNNSKFITF